MLIDQREKKPYAFEGLKTDKRLGSKPIRVTTRMCHLKTGDYTLEGYEDLVAVEKKSLEDLFGTLGSGRDRFERELLRLSTYRFAAVVIEGDWRAILGSYPDGLVALRHNIETRARAGDESAPWAVWLSWLNEAMPGPPPRSELPPKVVYRSVLAWQVRYPAVHWVACPDRRFAEITTFRLLERYLKEVMNPDEREQPPAMPAVS